MIIHFDEVKDKVIKVLSRLENFDFYMIRNIFGRISLYIQPNNDLFDVGIVDETTKQIQKEIGDEWVETIELLSSDSFISQLIKEETIEKYEKNIYFCERHLTRLNWFNPNKSINQRDSVLNNKKSKIVTFYSFKGGLGRTTSLVLTALFLVRFGKKVVLVDFDLEAPGLSTLLQPENNEFPRFGVVDFLLEYQIYKNSNYSLNIDEYIYSIQDKELVGTKGGELYILQAANLNADNIDTYMEKISRIDFGTPVYQNEDNPIKNMFIQISEQLDPDFIFLDARTGIHDVGGLTLIRMSDLGILIFYGNEQNYAGMRLVLPRVIKIELPFFLINGPVPLSESEKEEEEQYFIERSYSIFLESGYYKDKDIPDIYQENADHYPFIVKYNPDAVLINSKRKIRFLLETNGKDNIYLKLAEEISAHSKEDRLSLINDFSFENSSRTDMLSAIAGITGDSASAENEFRNLDDLRKNFFPLKDHRFIFEQDKFLILGPKGSGKTALFLMLEYPSYAHELAKFVGVSSEYINKTDWVTGLKNSKDHPSRSNFDAIGEANDIQLYIRYWRCLAVKSLYFRAKEVMGNIDNNIENIATSSLITIKEIAKDITFAEKIENFFNEYESSLEKANKNVIITYDALDVLLDKKYRGTMIAALISLWFEYLVRYKNIRAKIFLRDDIFRNEVREGITDKVKLRNYTANLAWEYDYLLAMVWKRITERCTTLETLFNNLLKPLGLSMVKISELIGLVPKADQEGNKAILKAIVGEKMGSGNKAYSYNWILYHLGDANNNIVPRSILALFAYAAKQELEECLDRVTNFPLIRPKNFELVTREVSDNRVDDLLEEYGEYKNIFIGLKNYLQYFPATDEEFKSALRQCGVPIGKEVNVIEELNDIGVIRTYQRRLKDPIRYHIPDIFLLGLKLSRRGPGYYNEFKKK